MKNATYWIVAVPNERDAHTSWDEMVSFATRTNFADTNEFPIPSDLIVGTLDSLMVILSAYFLLYLIYLKIMIDTQ